MGTTHPRKLLQPQVADDFIPVQGHQFQVTFIIHRQTLAPDIGGLERHLQYLASDRWVVVERGDTREMGFSEACEGD